MIAPNLDAAQAAAGTDYFRLVLLVGPVESGKTARLRTFAESAGCPLVSVSGTAAARLLEFSVRQRKQRVADIVAALVGHDGATVIALDDLELLFEPSLAVDPLRLLQSLARNRTIVAAWPGSYADDTLSYADAGHPEHRLYRSPEAIVVLSGTLPATQPTA